MPVYVTYFFQLLLILHVLKTGRDRYWIFILLFIPLIGGVAYLVMEILPELTGGVSGQRAMRGMMQLVDPGGDIRECARAWAQSASAENGRRYAQALITANRASEALDVLDKARSGFFTNDPTLLLLEAQARFLEEDWAESLKCLEKTRDKNPEFYSAVGHLLHARALEASGRIEEAIDEYVEVSGYFPGAEARYRLALALEANGETAQAKTELEALISEAELGPAHFRREQKHWLKAAKKSLQSLT